MRATRAFVIAAVCFAVVSTPRVAPADEADACAGAAEESQPLRRAGKLRAARDKLLVCARPACPLIVATDCKKWLGEVDAELATILIRATDGAGVEVLDVQVSLDGAPFLDRLTTAPVTMDPGKHRLRFERAGADTVEQELVLRAGERARDVAVMLRARAGAVAPSSSSSATAKPPGPPEGGAPVGTWVLGAVGVAAMGVGTYFWIAGRTDYSDLRSSCGATRTCASADVDRLKTKLQIGDVVFGVGVLSLGAGLVWGLSSSRPSRVGLDVHPMRGGGVVTFAAALR